MPGDPYKKATAGQPFSFPARLYNDVIDVVKASKAKRAGQQTGGEAAKLRPTELLVKNTTAGSLDRFAVLGIDGPLISPTDNEDAFASVIGVEGVEPAAEHLTGRFVVLLEPIAAGETGRAAAGGVTICQVNVSDETHQYANAVDGSATELESATSGPIFLLWVESGTGTGKLAIGRFGGTGGDAMRWGKQASYTAGSNAVTLTPCDAAGTPTGEDDVEVAITLPAGKVGCSFYGGEDDDVLAYWEKDGERWLVSVPMPATTTKRAVFQAVTTSGQGGWDYARTVNP